MKKRTNLVLMSAAILTVASAAMHSSEFEIFDDHVKAESNDTTGSETTANDLTLAEADRDASEKKLNEAKKNKALFTDLKAASDAGTSILNSEFTATHALIDSTNKSIVKAKEDNKSQQATIADQEKIVKDAEERIINLVNVRDLALNKMVDLENSKLAGNKSLVKAQTSMSGMTKEVAELEKQLPKLKEEYKSSNDELNRIKKLLAAAEKDLSDAKDDDAKSNARGNIKTFNTALKDAQADFDMKSDEVKSTEQKIASNKAQIASDKEAISAASKDVGKIKLAIEEQSKAVEDNQGLIKEQVEKAYTAYKAIGLANEAIEANNDLIESQTQFVKDVEKGIDKLKEDFKTKIATSDEAKGLLDAATTDFDNAADEYKTKDKTLSDLRQAKRVNDLNEKSKALNLYLQLPNVKPADDAGLDDASDRILKQNNSLSDADKKAAAERRRKIAEKFSPIITTEAKKSEKGTFIVRSIDSEGRALDEVRYDYNDGDKLQVSPQQIDHYKYLKASFIAEDGSVTEVDPTKPFEASKRGTLLYVYDKNEIDDPSDRVNREKTEDKKDDKINTATSVGDAKNDTQPNRAASVSRIDRSNGIQQSDDGMLTGVKFAKAEDGSIFVEGLISRDLLGSKTLKDSGFDKIIIKTTDGEIIGEFAIGEDFKFSGKLNKDIKSNTALSAEYGGKIYNLMYRVQDQSSNSDQRHDQLSDNSEGSNSQDGGQSSNDKTVSKSKILPKTGQSSNLTSIILGSIMTTAGIAVSVLKKFKHF